MVHLIKDEEGNPIGWELKPETDKEQEIAGTIRDLQFFGFDETHIKYNGLNLLDESKGKELGNIKSVQW